ncbi:MAG: hypothetical protein JXQ81_09800 [Desulfuromonadales bacterium]|nr:hypothetical protein [Desulfuromonadales bacterium]MBN2792787.1 hypothetical protein [Desulfuromonadales bacterium]
MTSFSLRLLDAAHGEEIKGVTSFVGEDVSGSFGILPGHARMMTNLSVGLARFRGASETWHYLALPGGVLYFHEDVLTLCARRYFIDDDYLLISQALEKHLLEEQEKLKTLKENLLHMEEEIFRRLWKKKLRTID